MIDWVSIVRHSRRRFSNYVGSGRPIRTKKSRPLSAAPKPIIATGAPQSPPARNYSCCCASHVSGVSRGGLKFNELIYTRPINYFRLCKHKEHNLVPILRLTNQ